MDTTKIQKALAEVELLKKSCQGDIPREIEKLQTLEFIEDVLRNVEKMMQKEVPMEVTDVHVDEFYCPACGAEISKGDDTSEVPEQYCCRCGQKVFAEKGEW